ncbi:MFS general substrate transporter [Coniochaeta ligniaria NRRL 30616]|uniref:MFS general substrate transporter n=1 Tax=Coniochaeta ligniaria NRRL 30616 TaxID=1408157 RepID=A0A1J7JCL5_9PEZI|nr:MFS general substrate transporter [Coniochaeta ligniaria NRRL 30616]
MFVVPIFCSIWLTSSRIWLIMFVDAMQQGMTGSLTPYVTSSFSRHSLTATTSIMSSIIGGLIKLPLAKVLDIFGRPQGFFVMIWFMVVGLVMMAACQNVQTYAAAQVFYWVGYNGVSYCCGIFIADTSALKNRAFAFAFINSPYIATVWIGGPLATAFLGSAGGFRWGFGAFTIITPFVTLPLFFVFWLNYRKAKKNGMLIKRESKGTFWLSLKYYFIEFDVIGLLLIAGGLALFLLPFSLYSYQSKGWSSALVISMLVVGIVLLIGFALYEKYVAPKTFIPFELLADRTVLGACVLAAVLFVSFYIWDSYFFSFLQVVNGLTITEASYVANIYSIGSCFFSLIVGLLIRWTGRFKWLALSFGVPLTVLGVGLMIHFRQPNVNIGYIVMCQIFIAFSGGTLVICEQMAAMAATTHQYVAVVLAVEAMFSSIGGAIGSTVAAAIWTGVFPKKLGQYLPAESQGNLTSIYGSLTVQMSYPMGSPTRNAINQAYGDAQKTMLIAATVVQVLSFIAVFFWRDIKVKDFKQVKGLVV